MAKISVARKRKQKCGSGSKLTPEIARRMMAIQAENFGKLSYRRLCGKMELEGYNSSPISRSRSRDVPEEPCGEVTCGACITGVFTPPEVANTGPGF